MTKNINGNGGQLRQPAGTPIGGQYASDPNSSNAAPVVLVDAQTLLNNRAVLLKHLLEERFSFDGDGVEVDASVVEARTYGGYDGFFVQARLLMLDGTGESIRVDEHYNAGSGQWTEVEYNRKPPIAGIRNFGVGEFEFESAPPPSAPELVEAIEKLRGIREVVNEALNAPQRNLPEDQQYILGNVRWTINGDKNTCSYDLELPDGDTVVITLDNQSGDMRGAYLAVGNERDTGRSEGGLDLLSGESLDLLDQCGLGLAKASGQEIPSGQNPRQWLVDHLSKIANPTR